MNDLPVIFDWDGDVMVPLPRFVPLCNRQYIVGERYLLAVKQDRSQASHSHYFAVIHEAFSNLPYDFIRGHPDACRDADHLRKWALCRTTKYFKDQSIAWPTEEIAQNVAAFARPVDPDEYLEISVAGCVVVKRWPVSQSLKAMGKDAFQDSKQQVLDILADLIDVTQQELADNAGRAA